MPDPVIERFQAEIRELHDRNNALKDYVQRANFELRAYQEEFGVLEDLKNTRDYMDPLFEDGPDPSLLAPLLVAYDRRIKCLEEELPKQLKLGAERATQACQEQIAKAEAEIVRLTNENEFLKGQLASQGEKALSLQGTYQDVIQAAEAERERLAIALEENRALRDTQRDLTASLDKLGERVRNFEATTQTEERNKALLQAALQSVQQKEAALQRKLVEVRDDNEKLRLEIANLLKQAEKERLQMQLVQQQEIASTAAYKEALEELDAVRRENRRLQKEIELSRQSIQGLQQSEFEVMRKLKEAFEHMEECKVDLSSGLVREGQKDVQLANLREQMRQLLAVQTETHNKHLKVVAAKHRTHVEELKEELKAKDIEMSGLKAQLEKCQWEKRQKERELEALKKEPLGFDATASSPKCGISVEDKLQQAVLDRDEIQRRLDQEIQRHKREEREWTVQLEQLRHQILEKERKAAQLESSCSDLRDEAIQHQKEIDRLQKQTQSLRLQKDEAERKADYELTASTSRANIQEERLRLQIEEALSRQRAAEQAADKMAEQRIERERQYKTDLQHERMKYEQQAADCRAEVLELEKRVRDLSAQLTQSQTLAKDRDREAEAVSLRSQQLSRALEVHKEQLSRTTQKLSQLIEREASTRRELKDCQLQLDRERLERERTEKDRDRYRSELLDVRALLQSASVSAHHLDTPGVGIGSGWDDIMMFAGLDGTRGTKRTRKVRRSAPAVSTSSAEGIF